MAKKKGKLLGRVFGRKLHHSMDYCFVRPTSDGAVTIAVPSGLHTLAVRTAREMFEYGLQVCDQQEKQQ